MDAREYNSRTGEQGFVIRSFLILCLLAVIAAGAAGFVGWRMYESPGPVAAEGEETIVAIEPGMGVASIANRLEEAGVIRRGLAFRAAARIKSADGDMKAGEYAIPSEASLKEVIQILRDGKSILYKLTIPEGVTTAQALVLVAEAAELTGEATLTPGEGRLLPETYLFVRGLARDEIIQRMMDAQDAVRDELWELRATELPFSTWEEAIILASIVEKETAIAEERARIAAVFVNRMKKRMRLQSDPTIIYGLTGGEPLGRGLRQSELRRETPYNTYVISGLPPTPIANPGRDSIAAVLNPLETDDLFFVADGTGAHIFSKTYQEHRKNVQKWRQIERERNE